MKNRRKNEEDAGKCYDICSPRGVFDSSHLHESIALRD